jgi:hypothetical protein
MFEVGCHLLLLNMSNLLGALFILMIIIIIVLFIIEHMCACGCGACGSGRELWAGVDARALRQIPPGINLYIIIDSHMPAGIPLHGHTIAGIPLYSHGIWIGSTLAFTSHLCLG